MAHVPSKHPEEDLHALRVHPLNAAFDANRLDMNSAGADNDYLHYLRAIRHHDELARCSIKNYRSLGDNTGFVIVGLHGQTFGEHLDATACYFTGNPFTRHSHTALDALSQTPTERAGLIGSSFPTRLALLSISSDTEFIGSNVFVEPVP